MTEVAPGLNAVDLGAGAGAGASALRAVVDIGSNSVRLVVYDGPERAPFSICNEKALCGLGRDMTAAGGLNPEAAAFALTTLTRFRRILDALGRPPVIAVATAAVREAADGADFVARAKGAGLDVEIIDGEREARLAALGVISYEPAARGLVGDMGGGSLELVRVADGAAGRAESLPVGPLRLMQRFGARPDAAAGEVEARLGALDWVSCDAGEQLYIVGGAWRAIARLHMRLRAHPLSVLHHYELSSREATDLCGFVARQSPQSLAEIEGIPRRRIDTLPFAAMVLGAVIRASGVRRVVVSAGGLREGLLFDRLSPQQRREDPLLAGARFLAARLAPDPAAGAAAARVLAPLFSGPHAEGTAQNAARIREAACLLMDAGAYFHPDQRGRHAFDMAFRAPFYALAHAERAMIALALYARHEGRSAFSLEAQETTLLDEDARREAVRIGLALRFVADFSPKTPALLRDCALLLEGDALVFRAPRAFEPLMQELPRRRLDALAAAYETTASVMYTD